MKKKILFSKSCAGLLKIKKDFVDSNNKLTNQAQRWNKIYTKQPKRKFCKTCAHKLPSKIFSSHFANYTICNFCGHFNGLNKDTSLGLTTMVTVVKDNAADSTFKVRVVFWTFPLSLVAKTVIS